MTATRADDLIEAMRARFLDEEAAVPTGRWSRLWRTGRSAAGMATAVLGGQLRGRGNGLSAVELEAVATLTARLGELKGVAMKVGQILGYIDHSLPAELRGLLSILQTQAPATSWSAVEATIRDAFGEHAGTLIAGLDVAPIAVASIGQVHHGVLPDGAEIAVKVRHPGIADALRADFGNASTGAIIARLLPGGSSVRGLIDEARTAMLDECDLSLEAASQRAFSRWFTGHPTLEIPEVVDPWCSRAVLTTRWTPGRPLETFLARGPDQATRDRIGAAMFELFVGTLYRHGTFHADPHPGNLAVLDDDRLAIYDFGCVRRFEPATVQALAGLLDAVRADDASAIDDALLALGGVPPTRSGPREHMRALLRGFFAPLLVSGPRPIDPGGALAAHDILRDKRALLGLSLPSSLLFLLRLRFGLYAVLARLGAVVDWSALEAGWAAEVRTSAST
jgi:predicted unusual protein kinase regulating ubiquinone biosynthesis (AarF/ABC1/UbiB family)